MPEPMLTMLWLFVAGMFFTLGAIWAFWLWICGSDVWRRLEDKRNAKRKQERNP